MNKLELKELIKVKTLEVSQEQDPEQKSIKLQRLEKMVRTYLELGTPQNRMVKTDGK